MKVTVAVASVVPAVTVQVRVPASGRVTVRVNAPVKASAA